jgi:hypothetical protein
MLTYADISLCLRVLAAQGAGGVAYAAKGPDSKRAAGGEVRKRQHAIQHTIHT